MANINDYTTAKTAIFSNINDQPRAATANLGSNASDTVQKKNQVIDYLEDDLNELNNEIQAIPAPPSEVWALGTTLYIDTANGDDTNDGLTNTTPVATLATLISILETKKVSQVNLEQLDTANAITVTDVDFSGVFWQLQQLSDASSNSSTGELYQNRLKLVNFNFTLNPSANLTAFKFNAPLKFGAEFQGCTITFDNYVDIDPSVTHVFDGCTLTITTNNDFALFRVQKHGTIDITIINCTIEGSTNALVPLQILHPTKTRLWVEGNVYTGNFSRIHSFAGEFNLTTNGGEDFTGLNNTPTIGQLAGFGDGAYKSAVVGDHLENLYAGVNWDFSLVDVSFANRDYYSLPLGNTIIQPVYLGDIQIQDYIVLPNPGFEYNLFDLIIRANSGDFTFDYVDGTTTVATGLNSGTFSWSTDIANLSHPQGGSYRHVTADQKLVVTANNTALGVNVMFARQNHGWTKMLDDDTYLPQNRGVDIKPFIYSLDAYQTNDFLTSTSFGFLALISQKFGGHFPGWPTDTEGSGTIFNDVDNVLIERYTPKNLPFAREYGKKLLPFLKLSSIVGNWNFANDSGQADWSANPEPTVPSTNLISGVKLADFLNNYRDNRVNDAPMMDTSLQVDKGNEFANFDPVKFDIDDQVTFDLSQRAYLTFYSAEDYFWEYESNVQTTTSENAKAFIQWLMKREYILEPGKTTIDFSRFKINSVVTDSEEIVDQLISAVTDERYLFYDADSLPVSRPNIQYLFDTAQELIEITKDEFNMRNGVIDELVYELDYGFESAYQGVVENVGESYTIGFNEAFRVVDVIYKFIPDWFFFCYLEHANNNLWGSDDNLGDLGYEPNIIKQSKTLTDQDGNDVTKTVVLYRYNFETFQTENREIIDIGGTTTTFELPNVGDGNVLYNIALDNNPDLVGVSGKKTLVDFLNSEKEAISTSDTGRRTDQIQGYEYAPSTCFMFNLVRSSAIPQAHAVALLVVFNSNSEFDIVQALAWWDIDGNVTGSSRQVIDTVTASGREYAVATSGTVRRNLNIMPGSRPPRVPDSDFEYLTTSDLIRVSSENYDLVDETIRSYTLVDTPRIKEIHLAVGGSEYATYVSTQDGTIKPVVANIGYLVERVARVLGINRLKDGKEFLPLPKDKRDVGAEQTTVELERPYTTEVFGEQDQQLNQFQLDFDVSGVDYGQLQETDAPTTVPQLGFAYEHVTNEFRENPNTGELDRIAPGGFTFCHNLPQVWAAMLDDMDKGLGLQEASAFAIQAPESVYNTQRQGTPLICQYEGLHQLVAENAYMISETSRRASQAQMASMITQAEIQEMIAIFGFPLEPKNFKMTVGAAQDGSEITRPAWYPGFANTSPTIFDLFTTLMRNIGAVIAEFHGLPPDQIEAIQQASDEEIQQLIDDLNSELE